MNDNTPLVSIITPSYNASSYIVETIESVLSQTYENWEMIVVDDCSSDETLNILNKYLEKDKRIKLISNKMNMGAAQSRNRAIEISEGKYIAFLDSDDLWLGKKLEKQIALMEAENLMLSYTSYYTINEDSETLSTFYAQDKVNYFDMLKTSSIGTLTTIYNVEKLGKFYFDDIGHEDYVMKLQILKQIPYAKGLNEPLAKYRIHTQGLSSNKLKTALWQWHIYRKVEKLSFIKSMYYFMHYTYNGIFKYK